MLGQCCVSFVVLSLLLTSVCCLLLLLTYYLLRYGVCAYDLFNPSLP